LTNVHAPQAYDTAAQDLIDDFTRLRVDRLHRMTPLTPRYQGAELLSVFQPIFGMLHRRPVGGETLLRVTNADGTLSTPLAAFARCAGSAQRVELDWACIRLHLQQGQRLLAPDEWLFLNVLPQTLEQPRYVADLMREVVRAGLAPQQIVLEVLESEGDDQPLARAIAALRAEGFVTALDDFGIGRSNLDRIATLAPDIVKIDREFLHLAMTRRHFERLLPTLVKLIHETGSLVVVEGIESQDELDFVAQCNADLVQGYLLGRPLAARAAGTASVAAIDAAHDALTRKRSHDREYQSTTLAAYRATLGSAAQQMASGLSFQEAAVALTRLPFFTRCYLLDAGGYQVGSTIDAPAQQGSGSRFAPLRNPQGARWGMRPYFSDAMRRPGEIVVTEPYLGIGGDLGCVTLALALHSRGAQVVLGVDLAWRWEDQEMHT
jgi:EAL domain-containing protein (putative c-di-GMP-specific phosphodiesterase class I)